MTQAAPRPFTPRPRPVVLVILDGFGERTAREDNAVRLAQTPCLDSLYARYPHSLIGTSGPDVGLPPGQMGNSEVGHLNFGAGRIAKMDITRIDDDIAAGQLAKNPVISETIRTAKTKGGRLHLMGLVSDGGVHSSLQHLYALIAAAEAQSVPVVVHAFLDGRDVLPGSAPAYVSAVGEKLGKAGKFGTVCGRYWAMDRDNRWERIERAFSAIVRANGPRIGSANEGIEKSYADGKSDEFVEPFIVGDYAGVDQDRDAAIHFNFRPDRARELTRALAYKIFDPFPRPKDAPPFGTYACMTMYDASLALPVAYRKEPLPDIFPEILARSGLRQFRCAETEKYAHVTYFFNGGREEPFAGEDRKMVPSPKEVPTYDKKPEMSANGVADGVVQAIESGLYDFILVNFANPDMVGHTGVLDAAIEAVQAVDMGLDRIVHATCDKGGALLITADHGNCELMRDPATGKPHTAHTTNPVPLLYVNDVDKQRKLSSGGRICDVAPTLLDIMKIEQPAAMTGHSLLIS